MIQKKISHSIRNIWKVYKKTDMTVLPGHLAFFFVLSVVPSITLIMYLASILKISPNDFNLYFDTTLSETFSNLLAPTITNTSGFSVGLLVVLIMGIYICSNGMNSVIIAANNIYGIEHKSFIERRIKSIVMVFFMIALFLFIFLVPIFGNFFMHIIENVTGKQIIFSYLKYFKWIFSWFVVFLFIKTIYTLAPDKQLPSKKVNRGAIFSSIGWLVSTDIYMFYAENFADYSIYYSNLANIAVLMMWMYILAIIFVLGMAINYEDEP